MRSILMNERKGVITFKGAALTLLGPEIKVGDTAPDAEVVDNSLKSVKLSSFKGTNCILATVPSLDTPTCDLETRKFNESIAELGKNVKVVTVSMDLPFAQKRWCGAAHVDNVITLSDYREGKLGHAYGSFIKELYLLSRAVFIIDKEGKVRYVQYVKEVSELPDFKPILDFAKTLIA